MQPPSPSFFRSPINKNSSSAAIHTPSKRKSVSAVSIHNNTKNRTSQKKSRRQKVEWEIIRKPQNVIEDMRRNSQQERIDENLLQELHELCQLQKHKKEQIDNIVKRIGPLLEFVEKIKENKQKMNRKCIENKEAENNYHLLSDKMNIQYMSLKTLKDSNHLETKKKLYECAEEEEEIEEFLKKADTEIQQRKRELEKKMDSIYKKSEEFINCQNRNQQLLLIEEQCQREKQEWQQKKRVQEMQLTTIKIQMNPNFYVGFNVTTAGVGQSMGLDKDIVNWDKNKQRKVDYQDIKRFVLIQLYRGWRNILRKLSYQSSQYETLFGDLNNPEVVDNIKQNIMGQLPRVSQKKQSKAIVFFSEKGNQNRKQQLTKLFQNFNNGLIHINLVDFTEGDASCYMNLHYSLPGEEKLMQSYLIEEVKTISKEEVAKWLRASDKRLFCWIEIPVFFRRQDLNRYEEVYELVRKKCPWK